MRVKTTTRTENALEDQSPTYMVNFFQKIRRTLIKKGILQIDLQSDYLLRSKLL